MSGITSVQTIKNPRGYRTIRIRYLGGSVVKIDPSEQGFAFIADLICQIENSSDVKIIDTYIVQLTRKYGTRRN
jgi:formylmethanofuran dehydrogenase subunit B